MLGAFVLLKFDEPIAPDIVYVEGLASDLFLDDEASIERYASTFEHLRASAASTTTTEKTLAALAKEI
jgi:Domain of unknown function (DUF5753)